MPAESFCVALADMIHGVVGISVVTEDDVDKDEAAFGEKIKKQLRAPNFH